MRIKKVKVPADTEVSYKEMTSANRLRLQGILERDLEAINKSIAEIANHGWGEILVKIINHRVTHIYKTESTKMDE